MTEKNLQLNFRHKMEKMYKGPHSLLNLDPSGDISCKGI